MANEEHFKMLMQSVGAWNQWRKENPDIRPDLRRAKLREAKLWEQNLHGESLIHTDANLSGANLTDVDLIKAELHGANLSGADLYGARLVWAILTQANLSKASLCSANLSKADLRRANLVEANLSRANLIAADLGMADLSNANLRGANLSKADLRGAHLSGADFREAIVGHTVFADLDLTKVGGLDAVRHYGPSHISTDTLYRSHGQIPEKFLRGAGVPDTFIAYLSSLTSQAFEYYSCFISYSTKDQAFAERLYNDLQAKGVRCWFAPEDIGGGRKLYEQIDQAIRLHDKLLLILSEHSIGSEWVMTEIRRARRSEERDKRRKLFPIRLVAWDVLKEWECFEADAGKDLAVEVREYHIPDFSNWESHAAYKPAFDRLLRDLKAEEG
jgi:hypothetical protein